LRKEAVFMSGKRARRAKILLGLCLACAALTGCVERRYTIRTNPPGAIAIVNGEEIGPTPVSRSFTFYGDRKITLIADGYQTQQIQQPIKAPWWDNNITDFVTENAIPITLRDEREFTYTMTPGTIPPEQDLVNRAQGLRAEGQVEPKKLRRGILGFFGFL
jgi:hypothetical protein